VHVNLKIPKNIPTTQIAEQTAEHLHSSANLRPSSLIRRKHLARRTWQNHRNPADKKILNLFTEEIQVALQNYRASSYNSFLSNMLPRESNLWKATKRLLNQDINAIPFLLTDAKLVILDLKKCL